MDIKTKPLESPEIRIEEAGTPQQVRDYLLKDRIYAAYALGTLEMEEWSCCTALLAAVAEETQALYLLARPQETVTTLFLIGEDFALEEALHHPAAKGILAWITAKEEQLKCLKGHWQLESPEPMLRMVVDKKTFRLPKENKNAILRRLEERDREALEEAYGTAFGTPGAARLMTRGPYYGVWSGRRLISVAGTHIVAPQASLAALGNVWTRPGFRGQGLATLTVGAVTRELLERYREVVLNVRADNDTARLVYERLGYRKHCRFFQARGKWRKIR